MGKKTAEVRFGDYYAFQKEGGTWFDRAGIVTDPGHKQALQGAASLLSQRKRLAEAVVRTWKVTVTDDHDEWCKCAYCGVIADYFEEIEHPDCIVLECEQILKEEGLDSE